MVKRLNELTSKPRYFDKEIVSKTVPLLSLTVIVILIIGTIDQLIIIWAAAEILKNPVKEVLAAREREKRDRDRELMREYFDLKEEYDKKMSGDKGEQQ